ncbi:MAG: glycosyltransferase [Candidatus Poseidoniaceae archaeon]
MLGWISTWGIRCGIATYSRFLVEQMDDVVVMCQSGEGEVEGAIPCWKRDSNFFGGIIAQIAGRGIDTVVIQHQPGLLRFSYLNELLLKLSEMDVKVFLTMHNTRDRSLIFPSKRIEKVVEGLKTCSTVMVHSKSDVENLKKLGIEDNVVMIPHGIYPPPSNSAEALPVEGRVMGSFGFLLPHKGQLELVEAFERLPGWDELLLLCATREGSGKMEAKMNSLIEKKGLTERVRLVTDFLDDDVAIATLAKCELLVFPYQNTKESASGAVRMGVAAGVPLAVTPIPIFDDVTGSIKTRGRTVDDIVASISKISQDDLDSSRKSIIELRDSLQWDEVAKRIQALLK